MELDTLDSLIIAGLLVDRHGQDAPAVALRRAVAALAAGDRTTFLAWSAVATAAAQFLCEEPSKGEAETCGPR